MKAGNYTVKRRFKPARIVSDALSLGIAALIFVMTVGFFPRYKAALSSVPNIDAVIRRYGMSLAYRHYFAWIFPALAVIVLAAYLILTLKSHEFRKYRITERNAQQFADWYAFAVSLCKIPALMAIFDVMYVFQRKMLFESVSPFMYQIILYAVAEAIIIRLSIHKLKQLTINS